MRVAVATHINTRKTRSSDEQLTERKWPVALTYLAVKYPPRATQRSEHVTEWRHHVVRYDREVARRG